MGGISYVRKTDVSGLIRNLLTLLVMIRHDYAMTLGPIIICSTNLCLELVGIFFPNNFFSYELSIAGLFILKTAGDYNKN